jgi:hypothetical protein
MDRMYSRNCTYLKGVRIYVGKYDQSPGIYYENKGQVNLYNTEWQVVVYVDLQRISSQSEDTERYINHIDKFCREPTVQNWTDCYHFSKIARDKLAQLKRTNDLIRGISGCKIGKVRRKRGIFNFIGEISKVLFGTMDDEDAENYNEQIKHFEENSGDVTKLLKAATLCSKIIITSGEQHFKTWNIIKKR